MRRRVHEQLHKFGVGRRLGITKLYKSHGSIVMVPEDAAVGDEIWAFRGTRFYYTMRRLEDQTYIAIGDTC